MIGHTPVFSSLAVRQTLYTTITTTIRAAPAFAAPKMLRSKMGTEPTGQRATEAGIVGKNNASEKVAAMHKCSEFL